MTPETWDDTMDFLKALDSNWVENVKVLNETVVKQITITLIDPVHIIDCEETQTIKQMKR